VARKLYAFADDLGATVVRTGVSRTVIDVNRDPSGVSLYPGQATTGLCPSTPSTASRCIATARSRTPPRSPSAAPRSSIPTTPPSRPSSTGCVALHGKVVLYDAHSIRSRAPRLFDGELPQFNIGTNSGAACDPALTAAVEAACDATGLPRVTNGRFKGGWITRRYGQPTRASTPSRWSWPAAATSTSRRC
jgi:N-formylglutamate deformylase